MIAQASDNRYDVIVIGSGMGGLATASILAQVGNRRVLVLESHYKLGGFLHSFRRKRYMWDPGVHYVGEMHDGALTRQCMDLVTGGKVKWNKLKSFERFVFPEGSFEVPSCPREYEQTLKDRFPEEAANIKRYFKDVKAVQNWSHRWFLSKQFPEPVASVLALGRKLALMNTQDYLDQRFQDPLLKAIVVGQWPDYGTAPGQSAFGVHAIVSADFHHGGYYPIGGSQGIADSAAQIVEEHGGRCLVNQPVQEILVSNNRAYGVRTRYKGEENVYYAPKIVSNAGISTTFGRLVPAAVGEREDQQLSRVEDGTSAMVLFLGLNDNPANHGFDDANYWIYKRSDHVMNADPEATLPNIEGAYLSFGSLRNPGQEPHTAQIITLSRGADWSEHFHTEWMNRGPKYEELKAQCAEALLSFVEERFPGLRKLVEYQELSSPPTVETFTGHPSGQIYGRDCTEARLRSNQWAIGTSVKNLYLTGTDVVVPGVNSALMIGVMTAGKLLGWMGMPRIMRRAAMTSRASAAADSPSTPVSS